MPSVDSHILAKILEHLHGDGCTTKYVRETSGLSEADAMALLRDLGAFKDHNGAPSKWRLQSVKRRQNSDRAVGRAHP